MQGVPEMQLMSSSSMCWLHAVRNSSDVSLGRNLGYNPFGEILIANLLKSYNHKVLHVLSATRALKLIITPASTNINDLVIYFYITYSQLWILDTDLLIGF